MAQGKKQLNSKTKFGMWVVGSRYQFTPLVIFCKVGNTIITALGV